MSLRDLRTFAVEHEFDAYSGSLSDFDVHGNLLVTCGFSSRMNGLACDRFLKVYDLRMMRAITPLQVHVDPLFLKFIPTYTSRLAIISQTGRRFTLGSLALGFNLDPGEPQVRIQQGPSQPLSGSSAECLAELREGILVCLVCKVRWDLWMEAGIGPYQCEVCWEFCAVPPP